MLYARDFQVTVVSWNIVLRDPRVAGVHVLVFESRYTFIRTKIPDYKNNTPPNASKTVRLSSLQKTKKKKKQTLVFLSKTVPNRLASMFVFSTIALMWMCSFMFRSSQQPKRFKFLCKIFEFDPSRPATKQACITKMKRWEAQVIPKTECVRDCYDIDWYAEFHST